MEKRGKITWSALKRFRDLDLAKNGLCSQTNVKQWKLNGGCKNLRHHLYSRVCVVLHGFLTQLHARKMAQREIMNTHNFSYFFLSGYGVWELFFDQIFISAVITTWKGLRPLSGNLKTNWVFYRFNNEKFRNDAMVFWVGFAKENV